MEWVSWQTGLLAAAVAVPALLALYFLKLRRTEQIVSSTLLWKRAIQDLQVNAPFQRLRRNILLLLQMLALLAILAALAGPVMSLTRGPAKRYVILIDRSASMTAADVEPSRLDEAKRKAADFVQSLRPASMFSMTGGGDQAMVLAFDERAKVMSNFTSDAAQLLAAIEAIEPTHRGSKLSEALTVARAFAQSLGADENNRSSQELAQLVLFSDGRIADLETISVGEGELIYYPIGEAGGNLAITAMQPRRSFEDPDEVTVFATLVNYADAERSVDVQLSVNGNVRTIQTFRVPALRGAQDDQPERPGQTTANFTFAQPGPGVILLQLLGDDALAVDNAAYAVLPEARDSAVLLVTRGNPALETALRACDITRLDKATPEEFDGMDHATMTVTQPYDLIVLDGHNPASYPQAGYLVFGRPPQGIDIRVLGQIENQMIIDWRSQHAVLKYVNLLNLFAAKAWRYDVPRDAEVLAEFGNSPAIVMIRREGSDFLCVAFDPMESTWPFEPGFVMFCYNSVSYMATQALREQRVNVRTGEPILVEHLPADTQAVLTGPDTPSQEVSTGAMGLVRFPETLRTGVYIVEVEGRPEQVFAANLLDAEESRIAPLDALELTGQTVASADTAPQEANVPLWPWLVLAALAIVCVEWGVYNSKVRIG